MMHNVIIATVTVLTKGSANPEQRVQVLGLKGVHMLMEGPLLSMQTCSTCEGSKTGAAIRLFAGPVKTCFWHVFVGKIG
jgi:hypothetical protein